MGTANSLSVRQIVTSIDNEAAGPSYSVTSLSAELMKLGIDSRVMALGRRSNEAGFEFFTQDMARMPVARRLALSRKLARATNAAAAEGSVLHSHGLWLMPNLYPAFSARRHDTPLIVSPRGMLGEDALVFSQTRKNIAWLLAQRRALASAACFHATSDAEAEDIRRLGFRAPIAVVKNGIHVPERDPTNSARTILHLGRLHPKKGIDRLIAAWSKLANRHEQWRLRIVGPSELGYLGELKRQAFQLGAQRVEFSNPLFGDAKWDAYSQAGLFVLPTLNENFGMVVAEALAAGIPVISTKGAPWQDLELERCGWWIDHGVEPLIAALDAALSLPDEERAKMGASGRAWMVREFGWENLAAQMAEVYQWVLLGGTPPISVYRD